MKKYSLCKAVGIIYELINHIVNLRFGAGHVHVLEIFSFVSIKLTSLRVTSTQVLILVMTPALRFIV